MIVGIDPGVTGALAFFEPESNYLTVHDMPSFHITVGSSSRAVIDYYGLTDLIESHALSLELAVVEEVNAMPSTGPAKGGQRRSMGATSAFRFGEVYGAVQAAVAACDVPVERVKPAGWKKVMRLKTDKDASRQRASELFPQHAGQWARVKDHDRAEAVLLAVLGQRLLEKGRK